MKMTWDTLQARITPDERKIIERFKRKYHIENDGQLVRRAIEDLIGLSVADATKKENQRLPREYLTMYYFYEYCKREFKSSPEIQDKLKHLFKKWANGYWVIQTRKHNAKLIEANKIWYYFKEHEPVGRKKAPKRKRGRPKDTGYER